MTGSSARAQRVKAAFEKALAAGQAAVSGTSRATEDAKFTIELVGQAAAYLAREIDKLETRIALLEAVPDEKAARSKRHGR